MARKGRGKSVFAKKHGQKAMGGKHVEDKMSLSPGALLVDKISQLPDALLVSILSLMTPREAARTSVLSSRWYKVWTFIPTLNFDASLTLQFLEAQWYRACSDPLVRWRQLLMIERHIYVNWVNSVLESYQGSTVDEFNVQFDLDEASGHDIDRWVDFALEKKVRRLVMDFRHCNGLKQNERYVFPLVCNTDHGSLRTRIVGFPEYSSLRVLLLRQIDINGGVLECFLSNCPFLEQLCVEGSDSIVDLKVPGPLVCLKYLEITYCFNVKSIDISATNLLSFKYMGPRFIMSYDKLPNLVELDIEGSYSNYIIGNPSLLSNYAFQLETLVFKYKSMKLRAISESLVLHRFPVQFPVLTHLKKLELAVNLGDVDSLLVFAPLIKASPVLHRLTLKIFHDKRSGRRFRQQPPKCPHQCLKVVEIIGYDGCRIDDEFAEYLIKNAVMLEKMIINPRCPFALGKPYEYETTMEYIRAGRKHAKRLRSKYSLGRKLVIL